MQRVTIGVLVALIVVGGNACAGHNQAFETVGQARDMLREATRSGDDRRWSLLVGTRCGRAPRCVEVAGHIISDGWDTPFAADSANDALVLRSAGSDRVFMSTDDIVFGDSVVARRASAIAGCWEVRGAAELPFDLIRLSSSRATEVTYLAETEPAVGASWWIPWTQDSLVVVTRLGSRARFELKAYPDSLVGHYRLAARGAPRVGARLVRCTRE